MLKKLRLIPTQVFLNVIQSSQMYLSKQGNQILLILMGTITLSKLFNLLVLDQVLDNMDKGTENGWWMNVMGLPYNILRDIIDNVWRCSICTDCFYDMENFPDYKCAITNKNNPKREFSWIVPVCGLLHLEMNLSKSFIKLNWEVLTNVLEITLGFRSPKAQEYLKKGSEHHKLWY